MSSSPGQKAGRLFPAPSPLPGTERESSQQPRHLPPGPSGAGRKGPWCHRRPWATQLAEQIALEPKSGSACGHRRAPCGHRQAPCGHRWASGALAGAESSWGEASGLAKADVLRAGVPRAALSCQAKRMSHGRLRPQGTDSSYPTQSKHLLMSPGPWDLVSSCGLSSTWAVK